MKGCKIYSRWFGWTIEATCKFIGWFGFATGFLSTISYLILIVRIGVHILEDESKNISDPAKYYTIGACGVSTILIEFYMMLGWYLLLGIYKEDPTRLDIWIRVSTILHVSIVGVFIVWIIGFCCYQTAALLMLFPTCNCMLISSFGIYSIFVLRIHYAQLVERKSAKELPMED